MVVLFVFVIIQTLGLSAAKQGFNVKVFSRFLVSAAEYAVYLFFFGKATPDLRVHNLYLRGGKMTEAKRPEILNDCKNKG